MAWFLTKELTIEAIQELNKESARAAAIVGAAILENQLTTTVKSLFYEGRTKDELFKSPVGKLADFDIKAKLAYTLGLLTKEAFTEVTAVGDIRNKFAHRLDINSFEHEKIKPYCMNLSMIEKYVAPIGADENPIHVPSRYFESDLAEKLADPRQRFMLTVRVITSELFFRTRPAPDANERPRQLLI